MTSIQRLLNVRRDEIAPLLAATFYFACVLTSLMVLRPARDAIGMEGGLDAVRWLFVGTALVTLAVNPMFGWLVSRFRRMVFITTTYLFFAASLAGFYLLIAVAPDAVGQTSGRVFYVFYSVFNLFATMLFWALMADRFSLEQSKRLFGVIAVGGTIGAIFGPWLASVLAQPLGTATLLLVSAAFLGLSVAAAWMVALTSREQGTQSAAAAGVDRSVIGGSAWEGLRAAFRSRYLLGISGYVLVLTVIATFIYFTRLQLVAAAGDDTDVRTTLLARIDMLTQVSTLVLQLVVTGHVMKRFGVSIALAMLPIVAALGFLGLAISASFAMLIGFDAAFRAIQRAITRPARETLFTVVSREDKYKSKAFTDTFVYRGGDLLGAWTEGLLGRLGMALVGLASVAVPLALAWAALGVWLGRRQEAMVAATAQDRVAATAPASAATSPAR